MFELYDEPNKDTAQGVSELFYGISKYQGGKLVPKFPFGANCDILINRSPIASEASSKISRSFAMTIGIRVLLGNGCFIKRYLIF